MPIVLTFIFRNKKTNTCLLIDISFPVAGNILSNQAEKLTKYSDLRVEISRIWQCRTLVVPEVLGALGTGHAGIAQSRYKPVFTGEGMFNLSLFNSCQSSIFKLLELGILKYVLSFNYIVMTSLHVYFVGET